MARDEFDLLMDSLQNYQYVLFEQGERCTTVHQTDPDTTDYVR